MRTSGCRRLFESSISAATVQKRPLPGRAPPMIGTVVEEAPVTLGPPRAESSSSAAGWRLESALVPASMSDTCPGEGGEGSALHTLARIYGLRMWLAGSLATKQRGALPSARCQEAPANFSAAPVRLGAHAALCYWSSPPRATALTCPCF